MQVQVFDSTSNRFRVAEPVQSKAMAIIVLAASGHEASLMDARPIAWVVLCCAGVVGCESLSMVVCVGVISFVRCCLYEPPGHHNS